MIRQIFVITLIANLVFFVQTSIGGGRNEWNIIPKPEKIQQRRGEFKIDKNTIIIVKDESFENARLGSYLAEELAAVIGQRPDLKINPPGKAAKGSIQLLIDKNLKSLGDEGYRVTVTAKAIVMSAYKPAGLFYAVQTLRQVLPLEKKETIRIPGVRIEDKPRYKWRGFMLDCCRHFMSVELVKKYIDLMASYKMNVFHWHLTEDQGWRLQINAYPRLTEIGAWREENGKPYGGFYTQEQVREIVAYARSRHVMVVPEIELPGHSTAALAAYPQFSCSQKPLDVASHWGIFKDVYCPGKEETFEFLQTVLKEVCDLFPSPYIHIGGDEVPKDHWKNCPDCQRRMREEGLKDENELQGYVTRRIEKYLQGLGRNIIGWDEILEGGVTRTAVVQSWRGMKGAIEAASHGNYVISSPWDYTYFYCPQRKGEARFSFSTINSLERVYDFDPTPPELTPEQGRYVMGGEACMWTEYTFENEVDRQVFPRLCALSEALWTPVAARDYADFSTRLKAHYPRLDKAGVEYDKPEIRLGDWKNEQLNRGVTQLYYDVTDYIRKNGIYRVNIVHDQGEDEVFVYWVSLFKNNDRVARYTHLSRSKRHVFMRYPLRLSDYEPGATYSLRICMSGNRKGQSSGSVYLRYFTDTGFAIP